MTPTTLGRQGSNLQLHRTSGQGAPRFSDDSPAVARGNAARTPAAHGESAVRMRNEDAIGEKESDQSDLSSLTAYFAGLCEWCTSPRTPDDRFCAPCRRQVDREFAGEVVG